jgi:hypothetical protein
MNKIYAIVGFAFLAIVLPAQAQHNHRPNAQHIQQHHHYHYPLRPVRPHPHRHYYNNDWVVPAIIGGVGTAIIIDQMNRPREVIVTTPPPVVECTEWREIQSTDGRVYRERTCTERP